MLSTVSPVLYMFWTGPELFEIMSDIFDINILPTPDIAIFGKAPDDLYTTKV